MAAYQYVYHMDGVSKTYPGGKKCFENIRLNFLPGVKIGVVGVNGAGKSTLMKIMAGLDKEFTGEAWVAEGARVGYLPQEPTLDESLNVRENVMLGVKAKKDILDRYNELAMNYSDETAEEMAKLQDEIDAQNEAREDKTRQKTLQSELEWIRAGAKARQTKQKARINAYNEMAQQSERDKVGRAQIVIPNGPRLGNQVIDVENISKAFGENLLIDDLSFSLPPGGIVGVIGPNGAGKTTLFRLLTGQDQPDSGKVIFGDTVKLSYVDQSRDDLDAKQTVWEAIGDGQDIINLGDAEVNSRAYCSSFNFKGGDQQKPVGLLSGGERNRVHMARLLKEGGNVLLLDEPTNDLDVETLRALEDAIENFAGCAVVISHDRFFLDRLCTHILAFEGNSHVEWFEGNFEDYEEDKKRRLGPDALEPKRVKYKKFTR